MGRHIGSRIIECCRIVESLGTASYREVFERLDCVDVGNANKYCERAVSHGLMTVDRRVCPKRFSVVPGWMTKIEDTNVKLSKPVTIKRPRDTDSFVCASMRAKVNSIFSIGALV